VERRRELAGVVAGAGAGSTAGTDSGGSCGKELSVSASESHGLGLGNKSMEELVKKKESVWTEW
jgi:uncharacterized protein YcfJ